MTESTGVPFDVARLEHRVTVLEAKLGHLPDDVREMRKDIQTLTTAVQTKMPAAQAPPVSNGSIDQVLVAAHRFMDRLDTMSAKPQQRGNVPWLTIGGIIVVLLVLHKLGFV